MKVECLKEKLKGAVAQAERLTGKNLSLPILSNVLIEAKDKTLFIRATNLEVGVEIKVPAKVDQEGVVAVNGGTLVAFLNNLTREEKVKLDLVNDNIQISSTKHTTLLKGYPVADFPSLPAVSDHGGLLKINSQFLINGLKSVFFSAASSAIKPEINSVYLYQNENDLILVATDSFRLAERKLIGLGKSEKSVELIIPAKNALEILRLFENANEEIVFVFNKNQLTITDDNLYFISRLIDGVYPDYRQIMPASHKTEVVISRTELIDALKLANIFANKLNQVDCRLVPNEKLFEITAKNADVGENVVTIDGVFTGDMVEMSFNVRYLLEALAILGTEQISLKFNGANKPVLLTGVGDSTYAYLVMPMHR